MKDWIKKIKGDRSVRNKDGTHTDKHMINLGLNKIIDMLIAEIEEQEEILEKCIQKLCILESSQISSNNPRSIFGKKHLL